MSKLAYTVALTALGWTGIAAAQSVPPAEPVPLTPVPEPELSPYPPPAPPATPPFTRGGFILGFGLGGGLALSSYEGADDFGGFAWEFHLGGMIQPTLAVVIDFSSLTRWIGYDQSVAVQATMFDLQFWPAGKLWLKAGGGFGFLSYASSWDGYIIDSGVGGTVGVAVGFELLQKRNMAIDLQARYTGSFFEDLTVTGFSLMVGASWY